MVLHCSCIAVSAWCAGNKQQLPPMLWALSIHKCHLPLHFIVSYIILCKSFLILTTTNSNSAILSCKLVWKHLSFLLVETVVLVKYLRSL